ncbi:MAG TPA: TlpA disulfide reductase family protein [Polyangia bacterium]
MKASCSRPSVTVAIGVFLVAGFSGALGCATSGGGSKSSTETADDADSAGKGVGDPAPDLKLESFDGKSLSLSKLRGKVVLLDIWASWCAPCKDELPELDALAKKFRSQGVDAEIVAVSIDEDRAAAEGFLKLQKNWALTLAHDPAGAVPERLQPPKMPTSYLIDKKGVLRAVNAGYEPGDVDKLEAKIRDLL